jgi:hypothetical protein
VRLYVGHFLSGTTEKLSPDTQPSGQSCTQDHQDLIAKMRELILLKHYSYSTETTMFYTHVMRAMTSEPQSPLIFLP